MPNDKIEHQAVTDLQETLTSPYLAIEDASIGDEIEFIKEDKFPVMFSEIVDFKDDKGNIKPTKVFKVHILHEKQVKMLKLNGIARNEIFKKVGNDLESLVGLKAMLDKDGHGSFKYVHFSKIY